ncbi:MAG: hypothetical protein MRY78_10950 [Saprospiraceae bacterium]|nr:hypothetical protein [Saprospiraceae bacterium]
MERALFWINFLKAVLLKPRFSLDAGFILNQAYRKVKEIVYSLLWLDLQTFTRKIGKIKSSCGR